MKPLLKIKFDCSKRVCYVNYLDAEQGGEKRKELLNQLIKLGYQIQLEL